MIKNIVMILFCILFMNAAHAIDVKMIVSTPAGNGVDIIGRMVAKELSKRLNTTIIVENKQGAGGTIAAHDVINSKDELKLLFTNAAIVSAPNAVKSVSYNVEKDFTPIAIVNENPEILLTKSGRFNDIPDFLMHAKHSTTPFKAGIIGFGSGSYFITKDFIKKSGMIADTIPYNSLNSAILDLITGRIDFIMATIPTTFAFIADGKLDALAQMAPTRKIKELPIPSIKEYGIESYINWWNGIFVSADTPKNTVTMLREVMRKIKQDPQFIDSMHKILSDVSSDMSDVELTRFIHNDINHYSSIAKYIE